MRMINNSGAAWNCARCVSWIPQCASRSVSCIVSQINVALRLRNLLLDTISLASHDFSTYCTVLCGKLRFSGPKPIETPGSDVGVRLGLRNLLLDPMSLL